MKKTRYLLAIGLLAFAVQARADWIGSDITDIINNVKTILAEVMGDVKDTAQDLKRQLTSLQQKGDTVKETVEDALDLIAHRRTPFLDFVTGPNHDLDRCGQYTACIDFRLDLENFVLDMADLKPKFPQIEQHGLGDGTILVDVIDHLPPLVLFGLYEVLNKVPNWQDTPKNLADLFDEIGDPDVFSAEPLGASAASATSTPGVSSSGPNPSPGFGQASFGSPGTKLDIFCSKGKSLRADPARLNRVRAGWTWVSNMLDGVSEFTDALVHIEVIGEGSSIPILVKGFMKTAGKAIESIFASVDAHRANLALCKQIETDVAQRTQLREYRTDAGNKKAYWVVKGIVQGQGIVSPTAESLLNQAGNFYAESKFQNAYNKICDAYAAL
ncbi:MAG TPA: hypothetical protein VMM27_11130 [Casimicrobiaceae bacterium]|nr:hypothetical protein [Casimicrobiaceae bacterium]